jgi:hypothetical protein
LIHGAGRPAGGYGRALRARDLAPLLPGGRIRTSWTGWYEFDRAAVVGWGRFRPVSEREAEPVGAALPWQRGAYLALFPVLRMILLWPDAAGGPAGRWLALPFNESDAHQRFGLPSGEPLPVHLCDPTDGAAPFERVIARVDGATLWFDGPDPLADPPTPTGCARRPRRRSRRPGCPAWPRRATGATLPAGARLRASRRGHRPGDQRG